MLTNISYSLLSLAIPYLQLTMTLYNHIYADVPIYKQWRTLPSIVLAFYFLFIRIIKCFQYKLIHEYICPFHLHSAKNTQNLSFAAFLTHDREGIQETERIGWDKNNIFTVFPFTLYLALFIFLMLLKLKVYVTEESLLRSFFQQCSYIMDFPWELLWNQSIFWTFYPNRVGTNDYFPF
jgi:uncharacterized membrane protein